MLITIANELCTAVISTLGAEVQSFQFRGDETEYIWQADESVWPRHAPLLFPIVGRLKDGQYSLAGEIYQTAGPHGFARDLEFTVVAQKEDSVTFRLVASEETRKVYPFDFRLDITYALDEITLVKEHVILNQGAEVMYYELGGHDGYNICMEAGEEMEDYYVDFGDLESIIEVGKDADVFLTEERSERLLEDGKLVLRKETFADDAIIIHKPEFHSITLRSSKSNRGLTMDFTGFDVIAVWTKYQEVDVRFLCLEPWTTLPDCSYLGKEIEEKIGIRVLESKESEAFTFKVTFHK